MSEIVAFRLESGEEVFLESVAGTPRDDMPMMAGITERVIKEASETFEAALAKVKPAAQAVVNAFRELNEPDEIGLEFGIQFKSSANAFVLTGEGTASFKLSLKWTSKKSSQV